MVTVVESFENLLRTAQDVFVRQFKGSPDVTACAPGRVNLIGEHIDYNDGFVLPMALPMVTLIVGAKNGTDSQVNLVTCCEGVDEPRRCSFDSRHVAKGTPQWANYVKGVCHHFPHPIPGFNAVIVSNVPVGGGLSSSAALEVATIAFLEGLTGHKIASEADKAITCQKAEHSFAGMPCGIMDQLISVMGQEKHALLIDCQNVSARQIPLISDELVFLICNSNVKHELSSSEYPTRRRQCTEALAAMGLSSYRDATVSEHLSAVKDPILLKRARHVITEIQRTCEAAEALSRQDFPMMGRLMTESHKSLQRDFEVSCRELDLLVEAAVACEGVLGSRMTGGGFGGCTVTLARKSHVQKVIDHIAEVYCTSGGTPTFYIATPSAGARLISS
ncbi:galactokinase-like [Phlebotomus argentipes]|uniref:galactokinase-like n=1 Tax=Phlebotomus argentipes TaxID=94469 RepID=UPI0028930DFA|nr:galactokinase-like [Phlebotomus argentipes]